MAESGLLSAGDPLPLAQAVQGNLRTGPGGHAGPLYGRTEHGRFRGARGRAPRGRKGVNDHGFDGNRLKAKVRSSTRASHRQEFDE